MLTAAPRAGERVDAKCLACGHTEALDVLSLPHAPVMVATVFPDAESARATPCGSIHLVVCTRCGLLFNRDFDLAMALAGARYESSQACSPHFGAFAEGLARDWVERHDLRGKHVIEVGCGQGDFMIALLRAGVGTVHGIDPLVREQDIPREFVDRVTLDASDLATRHTTLDAAALVCRHTIEHIPGVESFLRLVSAWSRHNGGAPVLFEAPATERIVAEAAFWDVFYEHCNYFSVDALEAAFRVAGLAVTRRGLVYGDQYIVLDGRHDAAQQAPASAAPGWLDACARFGAHADQTIRRCRARMTEFGQGPNGLVIWQGAAKTVGLLTSLGSDVAIRFAVDLNTRRHGFFLPPWGLEVRPPEALAEARPDHVVLMNPVYFEEVQKRLDSLGCAGTTLHTIDTITAPA